MTDKTIYDERVLMDCIATLKAENVQLWEAAWQYRVHMKIQEANDVLTEEEFALLPESYRCNATGVCSAEQALDAALAATAMKRQKAGAE